MRGWPWLLACCAASASEKPAAPSRQIHAFYYLWYGAPDTDGRYLHWDHAVLPHWEARVRARYEHLANYTHEPPEYLHAPFYPALGPYSSRSPATLASHFSWMKAAGVDVAVLSWTGRPDGAVSDTQGVATDGAVAGAISAAAAAGVGAAIHLEPYPGRSPRTVRRDLAYLVATYGDGLARLPTRPRSSTTAPVVYFYDAYHSSAKDWADLLCPDGAFTIRGTSDDVVAIATLLAFEEKALVEDGCFDGFYTYFATDGFTYGSSSRNWASLAAWADGRNLHFSPSAGPGYDDARIRPWNGAARRDRRNGAYFEAMLKKAVDSGADLVSITSWNEWGEGTQIEPSRAAARHEDYGGDPDRYLALARAAKRRLLARGRREL